MFYPIHPIPLFPCLNANLVAFQVNTISQPLTVSLSSQHQTRLFYHECVLENDELVCSIPSTRHLFFRPNHVLLKYYLPKGVAILGSALGRGMPAFFPASRFFSTQAIFRPKLRMVCRPSSSLAISSLLRA